jgi:hypothetical protein
VTVSVLPSLARFVLAAFIELVDGKKEDPELSDIVY